MRLTREFSKLVARFAADYSGSPAMEYSLIGALVGIACVMAFVSFGDSLQNLLGSGSDGAGPVLEEAATAAGS